ncbi:MAG: HAD family phosphatase [Lentisphaerae bacterium]|jgi:sugar-phosphatase|nr:HAD family phosphatase [Lentisphaerota bacterium]
MISAYLFDLDGTLLDTEIVWVHATRNYLASKGHEVSHEFCMGVVYGRAWFDVYADIVHAFPELEMGLPAMQDEMDEFFYKLRDVADIRIHGSIELLKRLSQSTPCCIVSGSPRPHIAEGIEIMGIEDCVSFYLGSSDYPFGKPHPSGFLLAAERLGVSPSECVVFEDSEVGIASGKAAGMKVVALSRPRHPKQNVAAADVVLEDLADFKEDIFN